MSVVAVVLVLASHMHGMSASSTPRTSGRVTLYPPAGGKLAGRPSMPPPSSARVVPVHMSDDTHEEIRPPAAHQVCPAAPASPAAASELAGQRQSQRSFPPAAQTHPWRYPPPSHCYRVDYSVTSAFVQTHSSVVCLSVVMGPASRLWLVV